MFWKTTPHLEIIALTDWYESAKTNMEKRVKHAEAWMNSLICACDQKDRYLWAKACADGYMDFDLPEEYLAKLVAEGYLTK